MVVTSSNWARQLRAGARSIYNRVHPDRRELGRIARAGIEQFQPDTRTVMNRHPKMFRLLSEGLPDKERPRILSFGCSTGEEVRSLRAYCPHALITGIDCNRRALARARRKDKGPLSSYFESDRPDPAQRYDAVLALAVFRHGGSRAAMTLQDCTTVLPFDRVNAAVARLDQVLEQGGWLAWANNQFRFEDMEVSRNYSGAIVAGRPTNLDALFGPDNLLVEISSRTPLIYRKVA